MKNNKRKMVLTLIILFLAITFLPLTAKASLVDNISCAGNTGESCSLNDFIKIGVNVANFILGIVGSLALLMFIYGGFLFLLSQGSKEKIEKGKNTLLNAILGLVIVFTSYMIIQFVMTAFGYIEKDTGQIHEKEFNKNGEWNKPQGVE